MFHPHSLFCHYVPPDHASSFLPVWLLIVTFPGHIHIHHYLRPFALSTPSNSFILKRPFVALTKHILLAHITEALFIACPVTFPRVTGVTIVLLHLP